MRTIISTVGTSLLTNAAKALGASEPDEKRLFHYLSITSPELASAETNSLAKLWEEGDRLIFLHSHTDHGKLCADVLCRSFCDKKVSAVLEEVPDLSYQESRFKMLGLRSLVNTMIRLIRDERKKGAKVILNATGGFKAEIAYATLIGLLFDVPVFYIHEAFREIIEMPPTPIAWDYTLLSDHEEFFVWLDEEPRGTAEVDTRLKRLPPEFRFFLTEVDGFSYLSPAGEVFYKAFVDVVEASIGHPVYLSSRARNAYEGMEISVRHRFDREMEKIHAPVLRRSCSDHVRNCDCLVFPKGHRAERIFFYEKEDSVYICELASHGDKSYENRIEKGIHKKDYEGFERMKYPSH